MTEFAPRRRRHSSVGVHLGDHQGSRLPSGHAATDWSGGRVGSPLYLADQGPRLPGGRAADGGVGGSGRRSDRSVAANGKARSMAADAKVRTAVTDTKIMVLGMAGVGKSGQCMVTSCSVWCFGVVVVVVVGRCMWRS